MIGVPSTEQENDISKRKEDYFLLKDIEKKIVINGRVPAIEIHHKRFNDAKSASMKVFFSLMSDYNMQDTLFQLKQLEKSAKRNNDDSD